MSKEIKKFIEGDRICAEPKKKIGFDEVAHAPSKASVVRAFESV